MHKAYISQLRRTDSSFAAPAFFFNQNNYFFFSMCVYVDLVFSSTKEKLPIFSNSPNRSSFFIVRAALYNRQENFVLCPITSESVFTLMIQHLGNVKYTYSRFVRKKFQWALLHGLIRF